MAPGPYVPSMETTRERIATILRDGEYTPSELADSFDSLTPPAVVDHVRHVARSLDGTGERLLVRPPSCLDCGFDRFDDPANVPSRCPDCKSERVSEPTFTVE
jgi:hypothetical protein